MKYTFYEFPHYIPTHLLIYTDHVRSNNSNKNSKHIANHSQLNTTNTLSEQPERRLWSTILLTGIYGFLNGDFDDTLWFNSPDGFDFACNLLSIDPHSLKAKILLNKEKFKHILSERLHQ